MKCSFCNSTDKKINAVMYGGKLTLICVSCELVSRIDDKHLVDTNTNCQCDLTEYLDTPCNKCIALEIENTCQWCLTTWNTKGNN